ncbi:MAG: hypothetical protein ACTS41_00925 [Candidatus Hodgkinia cicadicola]
MLTLTIIPLPPLCGLILLELITRTVRRISPSLPRALSSGLTPPTVR